MIDRSTKVLIQKRESASSLKLILKAFTEQNLNLAILISTKTF